MEKNHHLSKVAFSFQWMFHVKISKDSYYSYSIIFFSHSQEGTRTFFSSWSQTERTCVLLVVPKLKQKSRELAFAEAKSEDIIIIVIILMNLLDSHTLVHKRKQPPSVPTASPPPHKATTVVLSFSPKVVGVSEWDNSRGVWDFWIQRGSQTDTQPSSRESARSRVFTQFKCKQQTNGSGRVCAHVFFNNTTTVANIRKNER